MSTTHNELAKLIRQVDSQYHDPKVHGEGFLVIWHNKKREVVQHTSLLGSLFDKKYYEYYFVKAHSKPFVVKKVPFEWQEGTSDISLDFDATFQLRVSTKQEAEQLVTTLSNSGTADGGLFKLIDKYLHQCMSHMYQRISKAGNNLLDIFYQAEQHRGESVELNENVTSYICQELRGVDFAVGFTLCNAPEPQAYFTHQSNINETDLKVDSECRLILKNYQVYRKSGLTSIDDIENHMKVGIENAIKQHILGKSLMELLSNFKSAVGDRPSISDQIKASVKHHAQKIGYELESLHTLPDIAPLHLLTGLTVEYSEDDGTFKTGHFGGGVKLNIRMEVKAIDGQFEKHKDLLSSQSSKHAIDPNISISEIVERLKVPVSSICKEIIRKHNHLDAVTKFDETIRGELEQALVENLCEQNGLQVTIKSLQPVESEEASRLAELRYKKRAFSFKFASNNGDINAPEVEFSGGFEVTGLDVNDLNCWDAFESHDYGYRTGSAERTQSNNLEVIDESENITPDRQWKNIAIARELASIEEEIIRYFKASALFIVDLNSWINDPKSNIQVQESLLFGVQAQIRKNRGLLVNLERLAISDISLKKARLAEREHRLENMAQQAKMKAEIQAAQIQREEEERAQLATELLDKQKELIDSEVTNLDELEEQRQAYNDSYNNPDSKEDQLENYLPQNSTPSDKANQLLNDLTQNNQQETETTKPLDDLTQTD